MQKDIAMKVSHEQFETLKSLCKIINSMPGREAKLRLIGNFKTQIPVVNITEPNSIPYTISDNDADYVIKSMCKFIQLRTPACFV